MPKSIYSKDYRNVIKKLRRARLDANLKQEDMAIKLKKPQSYFKNRKRRKKG